MSCDQFVSESVYNPPNIIKIDVEGAEQLVIDDMENTLSNSSCKTLYCEVHLPSDRGISIDDYGSTKEDLFKTLRDYGFDIEILNKRDTRISTIHIKAKK